MRSTLVIATLSLLWVPSVIPAPIAVIQPPPETSKSEDNPCNDLPTTQWSAWGEPVRGLQCRIRTPREIERGLPVETTVEFRCSPGDLPEGTDSLDTFLWQSNFSIEFTSAGCDDTFVVATDDPSQGMFVPRSKYYRPTALDGTPIAPLKLTFRSARRFDDLVPGAYACRIRFSAPDEPRRWPKEKPATFWHGTSWSGTRCLDILPATPKTETFHLPTRLRLVKRSFSAEMSPWLEVTYGEEDAEEVTLQVRNGHFVGTSWECGERGGLRGGAPTPNSGFDQIHQYTAGDLDLSCKIRLFETCEPAGHFWSPALCGGTVLWEKTLDLHYTEAEIKSILAE